MKGIPVKPDCDDDDKVPHWVVMIALIMMAAIFLIGLRTVVKWILF